jgi:hypothetical protein
LETSSVRTEVSELRSNTSAPLKEVFVVSAKRKEEMPQVIDLNALQTSISRGIIEGTAGVVSSIADSAKKRHDLREIVDSQMNKVWELDGDVKLLKGMMSRLIGTGDESSGMVPRLERDMSALGKNVAALTTTVQDVQSDVTDMKGNIKTILDAQTKQNSFQAGILGGAAVGKWLVGTCITVIIGVITGLIWLFGHGIKP